MNTDLIIRAMPGTTPRDDLFKPYRYRGTGEDTLTPPELQALLDLDPDLPDAPVWPCGTYLGYCRHKNAQQPQCGACAEAYREYVRPCGTPAAYRRHLRNGEPVDTACREAEARRAFDANKKREQKGAAA